MAYSGEIELAGAGSPQDADAGSPAGPVAQTLTSIWLRAYEPIVRFTKGELFLPTAVGPYVAHCSL